jgi:hypothetical protein
MIHHGYCQLLHYMDMYHIWNNTFIDNLSVASIGVYHICYIPAVERQNHSLKKYMEIRVLYHIWYKLRWRVLSVVSYLSFGTNSTCYRKIIQTSRREKFLNLCVKTNKCTNYSFNLLSMYGSFTCFGIELSSLGSVPRAFWEMLRHNTPTHNILSTAPQLSISQKALETLPEDGRIMPVWCVCWFSRIY